MKEQKTNQRKEEEKRDILLEASKIPDYENWKSRFESVMAERKRREEAFDLALSLISKFKSVTLYQLSVVTGCSYRQASRMLREWRAKKKVILMTEQTVGHRYVIVIKQ